MNAILTTDAPAAYLTFSQRDVLRAARHSGRLERSRAGGVHALDANRMPMLPRFPLRTVNMLERNGYLVVAGMGWAMTAAGMAAVEEG